MAIVSDTIINDSSSKNISDYSLKEELANAVSHGVGVLAGIMGLVFMLTHARDDLNFAQLSGIIIYGASIIVLFLASTLNIGEICLSLTSISFKCSVLKTFFWVR